MVEKLADYHIHTSFCNHANGTMKEFVKHAISAGLVEMGFADHNPLPTNFTNPYRMLPEDMPIYLNIINDLKNEFPQIEIKIGIELDYIESAIDFTQEFVKRNDFDYIIGSVHYLNLNPSHDLLYLNDLHWDEKNELFSKYFDVMEKAVSSGLFDIVGHFDLPRRFWGNLDEMSFEYAVRVLKLVKKYDLCLEINTSGFRTKNVEEPFPGHDLLCLARDLRIPITLGSDSHIPHDVGSYFHEAVTLLKKIGYTEVSFFANRSRISKPI